MQYDAIGRLQKYSEPAFNISVSLVLQILTIALYTDIFPANIIAEDWADPNVLFLNHCKRLWEWLCDL